MQKKFEYLRIILTSKCNLNCIYCHHEGIKKQPTILNNKKIFMVAKAMYKHGIRKFKLMGGEPTLYTQLPELIQQLKTLGKDIDLSIITNGLFKIKSIEQCLAVGLDRVNVSIHSWGNNEIMKLVGMNKISVQQLKENIQFLKEKNLLSKLNYLYMKTKDKNELIDLIQWANKHGSVVDLLNLLTEEGKQSTEYSSFAEIENFIKQNFSVVRTYIKDNKHSLPSKRLVLDNKGEINLKTTELNSSMPFFSCKNCTSFSYCTEGIKAVRLTNTGKIQPCLFRQDNLFTLTYTNQQQLNEQITKYIREL